jgi:hypothetical protein
MRFISAIGHNSDMKNEIMLIAGKWDGNGDHVEEN